MPSQSLKVVKKEEEKKGKIWSWATATLLDDLDAVPVSNFSHAPLSKLWSFFCKIGMMVEAPTNLIDNKILKGNDGYWLAEVVDRAGYFVKLKFVNGGETKVEHEQSSTIKVWTHWCKVHTVGHCQSNELKLVPPYPLLQKYIDAGKLELLQKLYYDAVVGKMTKPHLGTVMIEEDLKSKFKPGDTVEVLNNFFASQMTLATILETVGHRHHVLYWNMQGQPDKDIWVDEKSDEMQKLGWCKAVGHEMSAPEDYTAPTFSAPEEVLPHTVDPDVNDDVLIGVWLECVDPFSPQDICAARVTKILQHGYLMIRIDDKILEEGESEQEDSFCCHINSNSIFNCGFCKIHDIRLKPPADYEGDASNFDWDEYFESTGSQKNVLAVPQPKKITHDFKVGSRLEAVDMLESKYVCPGAVINIYGRLLRIHFDGYDDSFDQWHDVESPDLFPIGWCELVNYPLQAPPQPLPPVIVPVANPTPSKKSNKKK